MRGKTIIIRGVTAALLPVPVRQKAVAVRTIAARLGGEGSPWPLLLSALFHLALLGVCCVPSIPGVNDLIMVDLVSSGSPLPGTGLRNGNTGSGGEDRGKQVSQFHARPSSLRRESSKPERHPSRAAAPEPERKAATLSRTAPEPVTRQATGIGDVSGVVAMAARGGAGSGVSSHGPVGLDTGRGGGAGDGHGAGYGGDGTGKGESGNGERDGAGSNGPVDGVLGAPGGPSFATRVSPVYPPFARSIGKEGMVLLRLYLDGSGHLTGVEIVKKAGYGFDEAAQAAARASRFRPAVRHGRPIPCRALLPVRFELEE